MHDSSGTNPECIPGQSIACVCSDSEKGAQTCSPDGTMYSACVCVTPPSPTGTEGHMQPTTTGTSADGSTSGATTEKSESSSLGPTSSATSTEATGLTTESTTCQDSDVEPNDTEDDLGLNFEAYLNCADPPAEIVGVLNGTLDVDWHLLAGVHYEGNCGLLHPNPRLHVSAGSGFRVCAFFSCDNGGGPVVTCQSEAQPEISPNGRSGCCAFGDVAATIDCLGSGEDDTTGVYVRIDEQFEICTTYKVDVQYAVP